MKSIFRSVFFNGLSLYLLTLVGSLVKFNSWAALFWAGLVLGLLNVFVRPILSFLTFPIRLLTFGFFGFIVNTLLLFLTTLLVKGFFINPFVVGPLKFGSLLVPALRFNELGALVSVSFFLNALNAIFWRLL